MRTPLRAPAPTPFYALATTFKACIVGLVLVAFTSAEEARSVYLLIQGDHATGSINGQPKSGGSWQLELALELRGHLCAGA